MSGLSETTANRLQHQIDDAISPDNMSAQDALDVVERLADYCQSMSEGLRDDIRDS